MADGSKNKATLINSFYQFKTNSLLKVTELIYFNNKPTNSYGQMKLIFEGDAENAIAFLLPKHILHGDYQIA